MEMPGSLAVGAPFDFADELNLVSTSTGGEAAPQSAPEVYAESGLVITAVERTGTKELITPLFEMEIEAVVRKDSADPDLRFEMPERVVKIRHFCLHPGRSELCAVAVLGGKRSR